MNHCVNYILLILGTISLVLGIIGIFAPLLPTTPFLLLTAFLYLKSSPKAYAWLMRQKHLGSYIRNYQENKMIPLKAKVISIMMMWVSILYGVLFGVSDWWIKIILLIVAGSVTIHILSHKHN